MWDGLKIFNANGRIKALLGTPPSPLVEAVEERGH